MGLEDIVGGVGAVFSDFYLAGLMGVLGGTTIAYPPPTLFDQMFAITVSFSMFALKNVVEYKQVADHIAESGWTPSVFYRYHHGIVKVWADTHKQLPQYERAKNIYQLEHATRG